jgi:hypothetical protein
VHRWQLGISAPGSRFGSRRDVAALAAVLFAAGARMLIAAAGNIRPEMQALLQARGWARSLLWGIDPRPSVYRLF